jgi:VanZ family protein
VTVRRLSSWLPPLAWTAIVLWASTSSFGSDQTGSVLGPLFRWLLPWATPAQVAALHASARKLTHLIEYAVLALLWFRALRREPTPPGGATWTALSVAVACALLDEYLQSKTTTRSGSLIDVALDTTGAIIALTVARHDWRRVADVTTAILLWVAGIGGAIVIAVNAVSGVRAIAPWVTTVAAALLLFFRPRRTAAPRRGRRGATARRDPPRS